MWNPSVRTRLSLSFTGVLLVIVVALSVGVYFMVAGRLDALIHEELGQGYDMVEAVMMNSGGDVYDVQHLGQADPFVLLGDAAYDYRTEAWVQTGLDSVIAAGTPGSVVRTANGHAYHLKRGELADYGYELIYAVDVTSLEESRRSLRAVLLASLVPAVVLAFLGGFVMAGRALDPVRTMARTARHITAESLSERLPVSNPNDEFGQLAAVFNSTLARLEHSFDQLRRFTADASHELRTPLTSMRSVGEVALRSDLDPNSYREAIGSMLEETVRVSQLLDSLLMLASADAGRFRLHTQPLDLVEAVNQVADQLRVLSEERGQRLIVDAPPALAISADDITLRQALTNVIHNAIRYAPHDGTVEIRVSLEGASRATVDVCDDGPGVPEAERERVFERFYRIDKARTREQGGTGLGLAIARWAVEVNGGTIEFVDAAHGACCRITLPTRRELRTEDVPGNTRAIRA